jgi:hypothetical protein
MIYFRCCNLLDKNSQALLVAFIALNRTLLSCCRSSIDDKNQRGFYYRIYGSPTSAETEVGGFGML